MKKKKIKILTRKQGTQTIIFKGKFNLHKNRKDHLRS